MSREASLTFDIYPVTLAITGLQIKVNLILTTVKFTTWKQALEAICMAKKTRFLNKQLKSQIAEKGSFQVAARDNC